MANGLPGRIKPDQKWGVDRRIYISYDINGKNYSKPFAKTEVLKIIFDKSEDDKIISSVETDSGEQIVLFQKKLSIATNVTLTEIEKILKNKNLYCVWSKGAKTLYLTPNRW